MQKYGLCFFFANLLRKFLKNNMLFSIVCGEGIVWIFNES